ncbi:LysR family transcriptional regulator [Phenylobacterium sp. LjRoot225]|uniref:LysR family transcriptional regulator n=1 Tax=Phenylobacterium sp. LjRoot225 TaxID=3342285 RepID=UPI003ED0FDE6
MIELRHLRYFLAVAEELHFGRAAARLGIEQSPLSRQIHDLEADLKVRLFERTRRSTMLTKAGARFEADARRILIDVDSSVRSLRALTMADQPLRLGLAEGLAGAAFGRLLRLCKDADPSITVVLIEGGVADLAKLTSGGGLDAFLAPEAAVAPELKSTPAWTEQLTLVAQASQDESTSPIWLKACADEVFILPDARAFPGCSRQIEALLKAKGLSTASDVTAATPATLTRLVASGAGVGLLPASLTPMASDVALRPLRDTDAAISTWLTVRREGAWEPLHGLVQAASAEPQSRGLE